MRVSVIVCTYNRCHSLAEALESVATSMNGCAADWEVVVVDNNSSDQTPDVVRSACQRYPGRFRYVFESTSGKSYALNTGIAEAYGDVLVFVDDDVTVGPDWLRNLTAPLVDGKWAGVGGRVLRKWNCSPPAWLCFEGRYERTTWPLVIFDLGQEACELSASPCGTNVAYRKEVFTKHGGYRTDLGPQGDEIRDPATMKSAAQRIPRGYEDYEFARRLMTAGEMLRYEPSAVVHHPVMLNRLNQEYFLAWWFDAGRGSVRAAIAKPPALGIPRRYIRIARSIALLLASMAGLAFAWKEYRRFYYKARVWEMSGAIREGYLRWFAPNDNRDYSADSELAVGLDDRACLPREGRDI